MDGALGVDDGNPAVETYAEQHAAEVFVGGYVVPDVILAVFAPQSVVVESGQFIGFGVRFILVNVVDD